MKFRSLLASAVLLGAGLLPAILAAAPTVASSTITAVTVYADRAVVTRNAGLELTAGEAPVELTFEQLPTSLLDASLQVAGHGTAGVTILDVTPRTAFIDFTPNPRVKALEDELRALAKDRRSLDDRGEVLKSQESSLSRLEVAATAAPTKDTAPRLTVEESTKLLAFWEQYRAKNVAERHTLDILLEELGAKVEAAQNQLNQLRGTTGRSFKTVTVRVTVATPGHLDLALSYTVPGASWTPSYDARVNSNDKSIALNYYGIVRQSTGEDWKDITLTLSTARPGLGGAAPTLQPWGLEVFEARPLRPAPSATMLGASAGMIEIGGRSVNNNKLKFGPEQNKDSDVIEPQPFQLTAATATVESGTTSATFKVATPATIPSDNAQQKIPVTSAALAAELEYLTTPKLQPTAFLTAKVSNSSDYPLLSGALNVFLDGTFVATSALRTVMPGEKFDLALGADEGVSVKHKRVNRFTEDTGLTNSGKRITYEYLLTIQNNKKTAAHVIVSDQVPVSRNEKIVVKQLAPDAKEIKPTNEGALKWTLDLKPAEKRELTVKFSIDYPNDVRVSGIE